MKIIDVTSYMFHTPYSYIMYIIDKHIIYVIETHNLGQLVD